MLDHTPKINEKIFQMKVQLRSVLRILPKYSGEEGEEVDEVVAVAHAELDVLGHDLGRVVVNVEL